MTQLHQTLTSRSNSVTPINRYPSSQPPYLLTPASSQALTRTVQLHPQPNSQPDTAPTKNKRKRGVVLTQQGWQKLLQAGVLYDEFGKRYTHEELRDRSLLDVRTISRILSCEVKVDKRTLKTFFRAFNLQLEAGDCTMPESSAGDKATAKAAQQQAPISQTTSSSLPLEELVQLEQRLIEDLNRFFDLLGLDRTRESI